MLQVSFDIDLKVNVFEANIRLLGGLLSAHLLASDPQLGLMQRPYKQQLLTQAIDLADRLLAAFNASLTGIHIFLIVQFTVVVQHMAIITAGIPGVRGQSRMASSSFT